MRKKIFALLLAFCMVLTMVPSMGFAEGEENSQQSVTIGIYKDKDT